MFTLRNKIFSAWSETVDGSFMDAYNRAHSLLSGQDNHDCIVIWKNDVRVAEVRQSRAWSWVHTDYRLEWMQNS